MSPGRLLLALILLTPVFIQAGGVYWTDRGASQLKRMNFDGSNLQTIELSGAVTSPGGNIRGLAVNTISNRIFWADNGADRILSANLDGTGSTNLYTVTGGNSFPADVHLDPTGRFIYWCDQIRNRIQRSRFDGASVRDVITNAAPTGPYFMDLDSLSAKIYWGDFGGGSIFRANFDGSGRETLLTGNNNTRGVRLDPRERMLYWINRDDKKVHRCPLSAFEGGTIPLTHPAVQTLYTNLDTPHGLTLDIPARKIYWADTGTNPGNGTGGQSICRGDFDGSTPIEILATGSEPWDVDLDLRSLNYAEWTQRCFRRDAPPAQTASDADPDGDGIPNAAEYAFDLSPLRPDKPVIKTVFEVGGLTWEDLYHVMSYRRRRGNDDLYYYSQTSTNLEQWTSGGFGESGFPSWSDGMESVRVYSKVVHSNQFMRVQISFGPWQVGRTYRP